MTNCISLSALLHKFLFVALIHNELMLMSLSQASQICCERQQEQPPATFDTCTQHRTCKSDEQCFALLATKGLNHSQGVYLQNCTEPWPGPVTNRYEDDQVLCATYAVSVDKNFGKTPNTKPVKSIMVWECSCKTDKCNQFNPRIRMESNTTRATSKSGTTTQTITPELIILEGRAARSGKNNQSNNRPSLLSRFLIICALCYYWILGHS